MKEKKPIEDLFRDRLSEAEVAPPAFVWGNVAAELARRQRRRALGFWLAAGVAASGLTAAIWLFSLKNQANELAKIEHRCCYSSLERAPGWPWVSDQPKSMRERDSSVFLFHWSSACLWWCRRRFIMNTSMNTTATGHFIKRFSISCHTRKEVLAGIICGLCFTCCSILSY